MDLALLAKLNAARAARAAAILVTDTESGEARLAVERDGYDGDPLAAELAVRFRSGASGTVTLADGRPVFLTVHLPPPRLIVIGAVHISQALAPMARIAGFDMTIVDPRTAFATPERFPDVAMIAEWPEVAIPRLGLDAFTARRGAHPRSEDRRRRARRGAQGRLLLRRRAGQPEDARPAPRAAAGAGLRRRHARPHPRADRPHHRRPVAGRDRRRHPRRDRAGTAPSRTGGGRSVTSGDGRRPAVGALVLAAGQSRRMGGANKLTATLGGRPLVRIAAEAALASRARPVVVVTGYEAAAVGAALDGLAVTLAHNPDYAAGLSTSLRTGLAALPAGLDGVVVMLADMPEIGPAAIDRLIEALPQPAGARIVVPVWRGRRGNPVLWGAGFLARLAAVEGDTGGRGLIAAHPESVVDGGDGRGGDPRHRHARGAGASRRKPCLKAAVHWLSPSAAEMHMLTAGCRGAAMRTRMPMSMWLYQFFFSPQAVAWQVGLFGIVVALAMPTVFLTRVVALAGAAAGIAVSASYAADPVGVFWWTTLAVVIIVRLLVSRGRGFGGHLNAEEQLFHTRVVPDLSASQVRQLLAVGRWRDVVAGTTLTRGGQTVTELCFVTRGQVDIVVDGRRVAECGPGSLVGEVGISTGEPATATAICATPVRYLSFEAQRLYRLLDNHVQLQDAIELAVEKSLREKLNRSNMAAAHPGTELQD